MDKLDFIKAFIDNCDQVIQSRDLGAAKKLQKEIISTFESEIKNLRGELDNYSIAGLYGRSQPVDYIGDLELLKKKLVNYSFNIQEESKKREYELEMARLSQPNISASAEATQTLTNNITVDITQALKKIDDLEENQLTDEEKNMIKEYLYSLEGIKSSGNKSKFWDQCH